MERLSKNLSARTLWLLFALAAGFVCAALRRWQLASAFEEGTGLAVPGAQASVILTCVLVMSAAWFVILSMRQPMSSPPCAAGQARRWDLVFLDAGDPVYPISVVVAAFLAAASAPALLPTGISQWQDYQKARAALAQGLSVQLPSNNGALTIATAAGALLAFLGLLQMGRDGLHPGRRGKGGFSAALPGVAGCIWLMESFRAHAANPVQWDYAPLLLAIMSGMMFYMDFAGISAGAARPRRLLWLAAMTLVLSAVALVSAICDKAWADALLLLSQSLTAAAVLWRLPPNLEHPPKPRQIPGSKPGRTPTIQEEPTDE